ncbi:MAG: ATPase, T2SS/T4P/T4SS family [Candidatus Omnitrophica bacterium]|nr:ATPase, T2SS/T4P/T4SS family [Candidatus Omnitrophota bacterium]
MPKEINNLLKMMVEKNASDLHITANCPVTIRIDEKLIAVDDHSLSPDEASDLVYSFLSKAQIEKFERDLELDISFELPNISRYRINVFKQRGTVGAAIRLIPYKIWSFEECGLPVDVATSLCKKIKGLVLVTGATGSGKSTSLASIESALTIAETGHRVFATLHTSDCVQTINRIVDVFPAHQQQQIRTQLSFVLTGVLSQQLIPKPEGKGRILAMEILLSNPAVRSLVRESKIHQIYSVMQTSQKDGMKTMNQALYELYQKKMITYEDAFARTTDPDDLARLFKK